MIAAGRKRAVGWALLGTLIIMIGLFLVPLWTTGRTLQYRSFDLWTRHLNRRPPVCRDIVIIYIDQKSLDSLRCAQGLGWPWRRDLYALMIDYLGAASARLILFDAIFSEPSVFQGDVGDDDALARAMVRSGNVLQALVFHRRAKGGCRTQASQIGLLARRRLNLAATNASRSGPDYADVTLPLAKLLGPAAGVGAINFHPDPDGVARRVRLIYRFQGGWLPALPLAAYARLRGVDRWRLTGRRLCGGGQCLPLQGGLAWIKYYGPTGVYPAVSAVAVIQSALRLKQLAAGLSGNSPFDPVWAVARAPALFPWRTVRPWLSWSGPFDLVLIRAALQAGSDLFPSRKPLVGPGVFAGKIVFVGASAAGLYDLRTTPVASASPGVEIQATILANLLAADFLRPVPGWVQNGVLAAVCLLAFALALGFSSALGGGLANVGLGAAVVISSAVAFRLGWWVDFIVPLVGLLLVFLVVALLRYVLEGQQKRFIRRAFGQYLHPEVVRQVADRPEMLRLGGRKMELTVLFSDVASFTGISESLPPEDLVHLLNRYLTRMTRIIMAEGGTVDKYEGDAVMAFWGAPVTAADHAVRACRAALRQQADLVQFRRKLADEGGPDFRVRIGLASGPMIVGNMGSEDRFDYTVMGDTVNLGSRLEGVNKVYGTGILINQRGRELAGDAVEFRELDLMRVKGKREPIHVFEVLGLKGEVDAIRLEVRDLFEQGLADYRQRRFIAAGVSFQAALDLDPDDEPCRVFAERCRLYVADPPPPDWDGVFEMKTK
jgi:adenylate cyclase